ncbi:hypothetical protein BJ085DRAFT_34442 [Dimargaris cristalligena]|uniref:Uncharacterized protein n=1 Tax=Dimargaris cristalligena TaxID=215637 RepID=A0A4Q0A2K1_9FUNG|nr:hypothetical protein BJ085DRAFT_34442 [Dimargaris cristalligena]|eukprot:RKP39751.1 hypothetical protein BJ085DRAFT_34442 [Dimargaris cristalligena]
MSPPQQESSAAPHSKRRRLGSASAEDPSSVACFPRNEDCSMTIAFAPPSAGPARAESTVSTAMLTSPPTPTTPGARPDQPRQSAPAVPAAGNPNPNATASDPPAEPNATQLLFTALDESRRELALADEDSKMRIVQLLDIAREALEKEIAAYGRPATATGTGTGSDLPLHQLLFNEGICLMELATRVNYLPYIEQAITNFNTVITGTASGTSPPASAQSIPMTDRPAALVMDTYHECGKALLFKAILRDLEIDKWVRERAGYNSDSSIASDYESDQGFGPKLDDSDSNSNSDPGSDSDPDPSSNSDLQHARAHRRSIPETNSSSSTTGVGIWPRKPSLYEQTDQQMGGTSVQELLHNASRHLNQAVDYYSRTCCDNVTYMPLLIAHGLTNYLSEQTTKLVATYIYTETIRFLEKATTLDPKLQVDTPGVFLYCRSQFFVVREYLAPTSPRLLDPTDAKAQLDDVISRLIDLSDPASNRDGKGKQPETTAHTQLSANILKLLGHVYIYTSTLEENEDCLMDRYERGVETLKKALAINPHDGELRAQLSDLAVSLDSDD